MYNLNKTIMNIIEKVESTLNELKEDYAKFTEKGNKVAGTRVRKNAQAIKVLMQELRKEVSEKKSQS